MAVGRERRRASSSWLEALNRFTEGVHRVMDEVMSIFHKVFARPDVG
jgi:hypothetical protein